MKQDSVALMLVNARKRSRLTQQQVAEAAGTAQSAIARYERGISTPSVDTLIRLLKANGLDLVMDVKPCAKTATKSDLYKKVQSKRGKIKELLHAEGATNIRIFGSVARGQDDAQSDLDLLVDINNEDINVWDVILVGKKIEKLVGVDVNVAPTSLLKSAVRKSALRDAIPL